MKSWAVANQKGGVGKTTTAVTLAGFLAQRGEPTLLVDLDPHGSLTTYFKYDPDALEHSVYDLFARGAEAHADALPVYETTVADLALVPSSPALATLDRQLGARDGMGLVIQQALGSVSHRFAHVFIDCPPMLGVLMVNAMAACDALIIPVQTEFLALNGLERMVRTLDMIQRSRREPLPYTIVPALFDRRTRASIDSLRALREQYADHLWRSVVPVDTKFREASSAGVPLSVRQPNARGARAYRELLDDLVNEAAEPQPEVAHS